MSIEFASIKSKTWYSLAKTGNLKEGQWKTTRDQLDFISVSESSFRFASGLSPGRRPRSGRGNNELRLQRIIKAAKLSNLSLVTPNT
ncbi:hypothetical protein QL285_054120 [Trifolium repens]|nr:hypothetical protein QL285_054120 [Trifolium repens]